jgi:hypothetical protein
MLLLLHLFSIWKNPVNVTADGKEWLRTPDLSGKPDSKNQEPPIFYKPVMTQTQKTRYLEYHKSTRTKAENMNLCSGYVTCVEISRGTSSSWESKPRLSVSGH